jgi:tRNA threonylcarbamoyladenosine biosynthesis protein TsaB
MRVALKMPLIGITSLATMAHQAIAETGIALAAALHDARRDEVYLEIVRDGISILAPTVLLFADAVKLLAGKADGRTLVLCGTAASRAKDTLGGAILSAVRQPDALWTARLALTRAATENPPRPLYLRAPDARLPGGRLP